jgi:riboflavin kinase / FMN adenylyltransferase
VVKLPAELSDLTAAVALPPRPVHLAIGMFDGLHLGHQAVIEAAIHAARAQGGLAAVLTFAPHPSRLFNPADPVQLIQPPALKARLLRERGVEVVITQPFTREFASIAAPEFMATLHGYLPHLRAVYVGENWRYGRGRQGGVALLTAEATALGLTVISAPRIKYNGEPISSTRLRSLLTAGEVATVNTLMGYAYVSEGVVTSGRSLGSRIGFPTLNLPWVAELVPRYGVYAVKVRRPGEGGSWPAVANFGVRPTVESGAVAPRLEVHVLGEESPAATWGPGMPLEVEWRAFLRDERRFADVEALQTQIARDRDAATEFFLR